jgi:predicted RNA-binding Zn-ribbon protein involved in translation (DUF1610 family)
MPISFTCPSCGKKLKAPDNAAGKSSKCPGCGSPVLCPEPVYEAELIAETAGGPDPFADVDANESYAMAPEPVQAPAAEARRPCPMCGEMIVASAAKCRYCGEVFDATLKKAKKKGGKAGHLQSVASAQRNLLICIFLQIVSYLVLLAFGRAVQGQGQGQQPDPALAIFILIDCAVLLAAGVGGIIYVFILSSRIYNVGIGILLGILSLVPCLGLLVLLMVNQKATGLLRENGYEVGLLGAKPS